MNDPMNDTHIKNATAVVAGGSHTCALLSGGNIECWGYGRDGELGNGHSQADNLIPVPVSGVTNAIAITAGGGHTCALLSGGSIDCWGANESGQLGNGTTEKALIPVTVSGITNATAVTAGGDTCALLPEGRIDCWGGNENASLGYPHLKPIEHQLTPVAVPGFP